VVALSSTTLPQYALNGLHSRFNEAYFNNLTVRAIFTGISQKWEVVLVKIQRQRNAALMEYPVNRAIPDAPNYHALQL